MLKERRDKQRSPRTQQIPRVKPARKRENAQGSPSDAAEPGNSGSPAHLTLPES